MTTVVIAAGLGLWTSLEVYADHIGLGVPVAVVAGIVVFTLVVVAWNQLEKIDQRARKKRLKNIPSSRIEEMIRDWLHRYGYTVRRSDQPTDVDFALETSGPDEIPITIFKKTEEPWVTIGSDMRVSDDHRAILEDEAPLFELDITPDLFMLGVQSDLRFEDEQLAGVLVLHQVVFDQSIGDLDFLQDVLLVRRGAKLVKTRVLKVVRAHQEEAEDEAGLISE